jgi:hypothetical protein
MLIKISPKQVTQQLCYKNYVSFSVINQLSNKKIQATVVLQSFFHEVHIHRLISHLNKVRKST